MNEKHKGGDAPFEEDYDETLHEILDEESARSDGSFDHSKADWDQLIKATHGSRISSSPWAASVLVSILTTAFWGGLFLIWQSGLLTGTRAGGSAGLNPLTVSVEPYDMSDKHNIFSNTQFIGCGTSTEEARSRGCVYDILANHYVHKSCFDETSTKSYMDEGTSWMGYLEKNKTTQLTTLEEMGDYDVYWTSQRDHIVHCGEMWKRQYRAFTQNWRYIDAITANEEHTFHCANYLVAMTDWAVIAGRDWRQEPNTVEVGFAGCYDRAGTKSSK
ncbi:hypothetical protein CMQ_798 [Grosmannia clavigera kw1407]|uniref:Uncharacterized protein n=1 Tax=Grosmannia clavigera (strain kw1407 / UAMH 11150) TaxID=655863 RepID=F0XF67_GROCL|nr:uncharacterized protein CMQ_798 [Grosmannia clavigera kw1407]EFX03870.1 hypothetical protein CMQ_798 [Grosmannia clavigera kw1407]